MNSRLKVLPERFKCSMYAYLKLQQLTFHDGIADITYCANIMLFLHAMSGQLSLTVAFFSALISCVLFL